MTASLTREEAVRRLVASEPEIRALGVQRLACSARSCAAGPAPIATSISWYSSRRRPRRSITFWRCPICWKRVSNAESSSSRLRRCRRSSVRAFWPKRRMSFEPLDYLRHILVEADYLIAHATGLERDEFMTNETLRRAFVRSREIVGEAAKKVPEEFREAPGGRVASHGRHARPPDPRLLRSGLRAGVGCRPEPHPSIAQSGRHHPHPLGRSLTAPAALGDVLLAHAGQPASDLSDEDSRRELLRLAALALVVRAQIVGWVVPMPSQQASRPVALEWGLL
jgi:hypothetical protein